MNFRKKRKGEVCEYRLITRVKFLYRKRSFLIQSCHFGLLSIELQLRSGRILIVRKILAIPKSLIWKMCLPAVFATVVATAAAVGSTQDKEKRLECFSSR